MNTNVLNTNESLPGNPRFSSLGIGVDNLSMNEAVDRIVGLVHASRADARARLVATLNVDFMVNALGYFFSSPSHPELLNILRTADLVTADGFPIVVLSKIMGTPIKGRVTGADLVPALASRAAADGLSLFLLGGSEGSAEEAAERLTSDNPGLQIAGIMSPMIHVAGTGLVDYEQDDEKVVAAINASGADILLIGLGNPKQEQWFYRNRDKLQVPVSIGVGGTFEFIAGRVKRAPAIIQRLNLEWVYRITQDPARLWKRYVKGLIKFGLLTLPIALIRLMEISRLTSRRASQGLTWNKLWGSRDDVIQTVQLPRYVTRATLEQLNQALIKLNGQQRMLIVNMSRVRHIELAAHLAFYELGKLFQNGAINGMLLGLRPAVRRRLEAGRIMDACQRHLGKFDNLFVPTQDAADKSVGCRSYVLGDAALIYLTGRVDGNELGRLGFDICVADMSRDRTCIIDLRYADTVESTAAGRLFRMVSELPKGSHHIHFSGVSQQARTTFQHAGIEDELSFIDDNRLLDFIFSDNRDGQ